MLTRRAMSDDPSSEIEWKTPEHARVALLLARFMCQERANRQHFSMFGGSRFEMYLPASVNRLHDTIGRVEDDLARTHPMKPVINSSSHALAQQAKARVCYDLGLNPNESNDIDHVEYMELKRHHSHENKRRLRSFYAQQEVEF